MKSNKLLTVFFLLIIFGILFLYPLNYILISKNILAIYNSQTYEKTEEHNLEDKLINLRNNIENKIVNYFPGYSAINYQTRAFDYKTNTYLYKLLNKSFLPLGTNSDGEYIYKNIKDNYYILKSEYNSDELNKRLDKQVTFYNYLDKENIDMYIYLPNRYEFNYETELDTKNMNSYIELFKTKLNKDIKVSELKSDDYYQYFYKTDHHWNGYGSLTAYQDIMNNLNIKPKKYEVRGAEEIMYRGSIAKSVADPSISEKFYYIDAKLDYKTNIKEKLKPMEIEKKKNPFYDYYVGFYYGMYGEVIYDYESLKKENILILGDSYAWSIDYLIASHFNKTYVVNLRFMDEFNYEQYIKDNNITKVIVINETQTTLFDAYNHNMLEKVGL